MGGTALAVARRILARVALLGVLAALGGSGAAFAAFAAFPGHDGRIAFVSDRNNTGLQIFTIRADGDDRRELASGEAPAFSPDGRRIAFNHRGISIMRSDGSHRRIVTHRGSDPSFSPNGRRLVFSRSTGSGSKICSIRPDGSGLRVLVPADPGGFSPIYSPTRGLVVYVGGRHRHFHLFSVHRDGSHSKRIPGTRNVFSPDFSPNGKLLVFSRGSARRMEIYSLRLRSGKTHRLTHNHVPDSGPAYSPNGDRIVFSHNYTIRSMTSSGSPVRLIDKANANTDLEPTWGVHVRG